MTLQIGQMVEDRYRVAKLLGQGGMGAVYRAWDTRLNVPVALKEMSPQPGLTADMLDDLRQQFQQEAQILATLAHPSLVRVTDYFSWEGNGYLVMDFVDGESLSQRIEEQGPQPEAEVLRWAEQLLSALAYCHERGVLHRDIKPQNIIITSDRAVLVDFGLVKLWDPEDPRTRTVLRGAGTPEYAPPEQYDMGLGHTDPRSDIYSLGATLYQALTGKAPPTATQRMANPASFIAPRRVKAEVSSSTEEAILKAMSVQMDQRFRNAQEMARALAGETSTRVITPQAAAKHAPAATAAYPPAATTAPPAQRKRGGRVLLWVGLAVVALICISVPIAVVALGLLADGDGGDVVTVTATPAATLVLPPTITRSPATPTVRPQPSPTPPPIGTPTTRVGAVLFEDDFGDPTSGWQVEDFADGSVGYRNGRYAVSAVVQAIAVWGQAYQNLDNVVIDVDTIQVSAPANDNNAYGVMCRLQSSGDGYLLRISGDGFYSIHRVLDGAFEPLVEWARSDLIDQGNAENHIRAVCDGSQLALFVNGELVATAEDDTFTSGDIALTATTFEEEATEVQFDDLVVFAAGGAMGNVLLEDDFSDPNSGWEVGDYEDGSVGYGDGYYFVTATRDGGAMWGNAFQNLGSVIIDVDATQVQAPANDHNAYGIKCYVQGGGVGGDGYALMISGDGRYSIQVVVDGSYETLVGWSSSTAIRQGNATNHIRAVCDGSYLALYVNDELLAEVEDATYSSGDISFMAATLEPETTEVHFDNLVVTEP